MYKVAVMMSTYNGEKYVAEQIESILCQRGVEVELFIRDDGSSDSTESILKEFANRHANIHYSLEQNVGVANSFMNLLYVTPDSFDFYAFADQDDIWLEDKLCAGVRMLEQTGKMLYGSNQECVDKDGNSLGLRYASDVRIHVKPLEIMTSNMIAGCTMVFTDKLFKILQANEHRPSEELLRNRIHDVWVAIVASVYDGIIYDTSSYIKYRQHENNVVGAKTSFKKRIKDKWQKLTDSKHRGGRSKLAREVAKLFPEQAEQYPLFIAASQCDTRSGRKQVLKNKKAFTEISKESNLTFKLKVWFKVF